MKINRYTNKKEEKIREAVGLGNTDFKGVVVEDYLATCENVIGYARDKDSQNATQSKKDFDYGASGGSTSEDMEVNVENQRIVSEVAGARSVSPKEQEK